MNPFGGDQILFRKPWESKDEASRATAVSTSNDSKLLEKLGEIAQSDPSGLVRLAALRRIDTEPFWLDARLSSKDRGIIEPADRFIAQQVIKRDSSEYRDAREAWLDAIIEEDQKRALIQTIAQKAPDAKLRGRALTSIHANGFLADCFVQEVDPTLAASILEQITDPSSLERVAPTLKKRSKAKTKALEARVDVLKGVVGESMEIKQATACLSEMEGLILGRSSGQTAKELARIESDWARLGALPSELNDRFEKARSMVLAIINPPATPAIPEPVESTIELMPEPKPDEPIETPPKQSSETEGAHRRRIEERKQAQQKRAEEQLLLTSKIQSLLADAEQAIENGYLQQAATALATLQSPLPKSLRAHEARVKAQFQTLKQWLHWSNNTQRDQLIAKLEASVDQDLHPDALRALVQEARKQWKELESVERTALSDRRSAAPHAQWRRFSQAIDAIYERIQPALEHRQQYQEGNLQALDAFIEQTTQTLESSQQDVSIYLEPLKIARQAIRRLDDLPPKLRAINAKRLKELMSALSDRVNHLFAEVEQQKRQLVAQAEQLAHEKDSAAAIETAKSLQSQWKKLGRGRRQSDQALWAAFRAPIDPLFESIKKEHEAESLERQAKLEALEELLGQIEKLASEMAKVPDDTDLDFKSRWARLADQWLSETQRPNQLNARFEKAQAQIQKAIEAKEANAKSRARDAVDGLASALQAQWASLSQATDDQSPAPTDEVSTETQADGLTGAPSHLTDSYQALNKTLSALKSNEQSVDAWQAVAQTNEALARAVVVEMEFLSGLESPTQDTDLKKAFQVAQLNERLNQRGQSTSLTDDLSSRIVRWYRAIPMRDDSYAELSTRFKRARDVLEAMLG